MKTLTFVTSAILVALSALSGCSMNSNKGGDVTGTWSASITQSGYSQFDLYYTFSLTEGFVSMVDARRASGTRSVSCARGAWRAANGELEFVLKGKMGGLTDEASVLVVKQTYDVDGDDLMMIETNGETTRTNTFVRKLAPLEVDQACKDVFAKNAN